MASTNPFASSSGEEEEDGDVVPPLPSGGGDGGGDGGGEAKSSDDPFGFDVDFSKVQARRERARAAKEATKDESEKPILSGMDADDTADGGANKTQSQQHQSGSEHGGGAPVAGVGDPNKRRPNIVTQRAKTTGTDLPSDHNKQQQQQRRGWFGGGGGNRNRDLQSDQGASNDDDDANAAAHEMCQPFMVGKRRLAVWPYDDYHLIQKMFYERLEDGGDSIKTERKEPDTPTQGGSSVPIFSRPSDPPNIAQAVQGLSLTEFEPKAEERAISIVSTWLFDAGLIDELLVNGGMTSWALQASRGGGGSVGDSDNKSVNSNLTSEGIEIGQFGHPIEGSTKMDKEISKLRNSTNRQLALINARLNDGVAATGSEVQELVNAVIATKDDIGRLRELSTYVSNASDVDQAQQFMLTKYPKLKQAINARRNLARCFRELDFFSHIPSTCDRLREELQSCEWTAHEWSTLRSVCREHVELEIFLVEAEAGMKKRLEEDEKEDAESKKRQKNSKKFNRQAFGKNKSGTGSKDNNFNKELIDRFLKEHVQNVWELGDEIRIRIMSGIGNSFDLAMNNPTGMVALVEAVEVYQSANDDYKAVHGEEAGTKSETTLRFTDMRAAALGELYKDFETRGLDVFRELTMQAADIATEDDNNNNEAANEQFAAVLRAANELTSEIGVVKEHMAPCFPPEWAIAVLWTTCVSHVCSSNILQQIGGPEGHKLPDMTVTPLLDLVAWVENFREIIEETFPNIGALKSHRTYLDQPPKLLLEDNKTVDIEVAKDSLAWVNSVLWDVHDLAKDEFLFRTKEQTEEWLENVYAADHNKAETAEGRLVTSLCEDVFSLAGVQLRTIRERLTRRSEALVQAVGVIFKNLYEKQISSRERFCEDFETSCAASNDFIRMSEKCEEIVEEIKDECNLSPEATETLEEQAAALLGLYSSDAVYAAQKTHMFIFEPIEEAIFEDLFGEEWLHELTHNELALTLVRTLDDFMEDLEAFLDEVMVQKTVEAQISSAVNFYIRCLLSKATKHNSNRNSYFGDNNEKAIERMRADVVVIKEYFDGLAETMPTLGRVIEREFDMLEAVLELVSIAAGLSHSDVQDFVLLLQKRVRNVAITKFVVGDIYHLVNPGEERATYEIIDSMEDTMNAIAPTDEKAVSLAQDRNTVPGLRIDQILAKHCDESKRKRGLKQNAMDLAENAMKAWRPTFNSLTGQLAPGE